MIMPTLSTPSPDNGFAVTPRIAVVIPCYHVRAHAMKVIAGIGTEVGWIIAVDDACAEGSGVMIREQCMDPRVTVIEHAQKQGVRDATMTGYLQALQTPAEVVIKLDGDGQMDPAELPRFASRLLSGHADYAKGIRFHRVGFLQGMPWERLAGNAALSFLTKLSSGYWQIANPTNGCTAVRCELMRELDLERIAKRYFFESDLLYHLNQARAVVVDVPMRARYEDETSSLRLARILGPFMLRHIRSTARRVLYSYVIRGFSLASVQLLLGSLLLVTGSAFGLWHWLASVQSGVPATAGTVMAAGLPIIVGLQMLMSWPNFDVASEPRHAAHRFLADVQAQRRGAGSAR